MKATVAVVGTLDTKGEEHAFVAQALRSYGVAAVVVDCGVLGEPVGITPDVSRHEVARAAGYSLAEIRDMGTRGAAIDAMAKGVERTLNALYEGGSLHGVLSLGGAEGTVLGTAGMRPLPIGLPKVMVSAIASGERTFGPYVGTSDIMMVHSVVDVAGLNHLSMRVLGNAAAALAGMAERWLAEGPAEAHERAVLGVTLLGNTQPAFDLLTEGLAGRSLEILPFHANGVGGPTMERLAADGDIDVVIDLTVNEVTNSLVGGVSAPVPDTRMRPNDGHTPRVVVPGCADFVTFGPPDTVPPEYGDAVTYTHNPHFTLVRASTRQMSRFGKELRDRLNRIEAPVELIWPQAGLSLEDRAGGAFWDPDANAAFLEALTGGLDPTIPVVTIDAHINERATTGAVIDALNRLSDVPAPAGTGD